MNEETTSKEQPSGADDEGQSLDLKVSTDEVGKRQRNVQVRKRQRRGAVFAFFMWSVLFGVAGAGAYYFQTEIYMPRMVAMEEFLTKQAIVVEQLRKDTERNTELVAESKGDAATNLDQLQQQGDDLLERLIVAEEVVQSQREEMVRLAELMGSVATSQEAAGDQVSNLLSDLQADQERFQVQTQGLLDSYQRAGEALSQRMDGHERRIAAQEEWVDSINQYRRQVNADLLKLERLINQLRSGG